MNPDNSKDSGFDFDLLEAEIMFGLDDESRKDLDDSIALMAQRDTESTVTALQPGNRLQMRAMLELNGLMVQESPEYKHRLGPVKETREDLRFIKNSTLVFLGKSAVCSSIILGMIWQIKS